MLNSSEVITLPLMGRALSLYMVIGKDLLPESQTIDKKQII